MRVRIYFKYDKRTADITPSQKTLAEFAKFFYSADVHAFGEAAVVKPKDVYLIEVIGE